MKNTFTEDCLIWDLKDAVENDGVPLTSDAIKGCAHAMKRDADTRPSLARALDIVSAAFGYASWNAAKAVLPSETDTPLMIGVMKPRLLRICAPQAVAGVLFDMKSRSTDSLFTIRTLIKGQADPALKGLDTHSRYIEAYAHETLPADSVAVYYALRDDMDVIAISDATDLSDDAWERIRMAVLCGHPMVLGMKGVPHPRGFMRVGASKEAMAYVPLMSMPQTEVRHVG